MVTDNCFVENLYVMAGKHVIEGQVGRRIRSYGKARKKT